MRNQWCGIGILICLLFGLSNCTTTTTKKITARGQGINGSKVNLQEAAKLNVQLGMAYLNKNNMERAKQKLLLAQTQAPNDINVLNALARFFGKTGQIEKSQQYYERALKMAPQSGRAHNNFGVFLCRNGQYDKAVNEFIMAVSDPSYLSVAEAYENAGLCALKIPDVEAANHYFELALKRDPSHRSTLVELVRLSYQRGLYRTAQQYLDKYNKLGKPTAQSLQLGIKVAQRLGDKPGVVKQRLLLNAMRYKASANN